MKAALLFLVDLPKPVHGMSSINKKMIERCKEQGVKHVVINTVPSYAHRFFGTRYWAFFKFIHSCAMLLVTGYNIIFLRPKIVYRSLNGGVGQLYDLLYLFLFRFSSVQVVLHHHSFSYLNKKSKLFSLVILLLKSKDQHVCLSDGMCKALSSLYNISDGNITVLSNLSFFSPGKSNFSSVSVDSPIVFGYLANISFEKGIKYFVETLIQLNLRGLDIRGVIAGPFSSSDVECYVKSMCSEFTFICYTGPLYGEDKDNFFESLDVFMFPSFYVNEAEPLVLYEAAQTGAYLVGTQRGCMRDVIYFLHGYSFCEGQSTEDVSQNLFDNINLGCLSYANRNRRLKAFVTLRDLELSKLKTFINMLGFGHVSKAQ
jgi:glycosyltransferase involved in cell wall biosynthesis